jgi:hypothetical protein
MPDVILGLDISVNSTGLAVADVEGGPIATTTLTPAPGVTGMLRVQDIHHKFLNVLSALAAEGKRVVTIVVEGYGSIVGANTALIEMWAVLRYAIHLSGIPYAVVPISRLKIFGTGNGNADKVMVGQHVQRRYDVSFLRTDWSGWAPKIKPERVVQHRQPKPTKKNPNPEPVPDTVYPAVVTPGKPMPDNWGTNASHWRNDEADAFLLAVMGLHLVGAPHPYVTRGITDYEARAVEGQRQDMTGELAEENIIRKGAS